MAKIVAIVTVAIPVFPTKICQCLLLVLYPDGTPTGIIMLTFKPGIGMSHLVPVNKMVMM